MEHKNKGNTHNKILRQFFKRVDEVHIIKRWNAHKKRGKTHKNLLNLPRYKYHLRSVQDIMRFLSLRSHINLEEIFKASNSILANVQFLLSTEILIRKLNEKSWNAHHFKNYETNIPFNSF